MIRKTKIKTLPQAAIVARARRKGENQHEMERWHNSQSREGGKRQLKTHNKEKTK